MRGMFHRLELQVTFCRAKIVIYDLKKNIKYTLTQHWDRSPDSLAVCISASSHRTPLGADECH